MEHQPPQNLEAEQGVLGSMLLDRDAIARAVEGLRPEDFYRDAHRVIFTAMIKLFERGEPVDLITLTNRLARMGKLEDVGGATYLASLPNVVPTAANVAHYLDIVLKHSELRALIDTARHLQTRSYEGTEDTTTLIEEAKRLLDNIDTRNGKRADSGAVLVCFADVAPKSVRWLWPGRIPLGKVTVLDGDPNLGKSLHMLDIAARVTRNNTMPDGTNANLDGPRGVVLLSAEDDPEDTIRPRLDAAGTDCARIALLTRVKDSHGERGPTIADLAALEEAVQQTDAALVIIDPLMAYLPDERDSHRDQDIRRALAPLAALAARTGAAVVVVRHLNKGGSGNPLYRGGGSIGIIGAARSGLLVAPDPDVPDTGRRILAVTKSNLAALPPALAYHVEAPDGVPRIVWEGQTSHTADALLAAQPPEEEKSQLDEAVTFLIDALSERDLPATQVKTEARRAGIAERTLERARPRAGVVTRRQGFGPGAVYVWSLHTRQDPHARQSLEYGEHGLHDPRPLPHSTTADGQRVYLRDLAESWDWPRIYIGWGESVGAGQETWGQFLVQADDPRIDWAIADLASLEVGRS